MAARVVQGVGAAILFPTSMAIVSQSFDEATRPRAIGIVVAVSTLGTALGPLVGGVLTDALDWRWVFFINVPVLDPRHPDDPAIRARVARRERAPPRRRARHRRPGDRHRGPDPGHRPGSGVGRGRRHRAGGLPGGLRARPRGLRGHRDARRQPAHRPAHLPQPGVRDGHPERLPVELPLGAVRVRGDPVAPGGRGPLAPGVRAGLPRHVPRRRGGRAAVGPPGQALRRRPADGARVTAWAPSSAFAISFIDELPIWLPVFLVLGLGVGTNYALVNRAPSPPSPAARPGRPRASP